MTSLRDPRVYLVDDDASVRVALQRLIRSGGFVVETFASGEQLLETWPSDSSGCLIVAERAEMIRVSDLPEQSLRSLRALR